MNYFERKVFKNWGTVYQAWSSSLTNIKPKDVMYHLHKPSVTPPLPATFYPLLIIFLSYSWFSIPYLFAYNCYDNRATVCNGNIAIHTIFVLLRTVSGSRCDFSSEVSYRDANVFVYFMAFIISLLKFYVSVTNFYQIPRMSIWQKQKVKSNGSQSCKHWFYFRRIWICVHYKVVYYVSF